jgi:mitogen-activated protein kinase 1/3
MFPFLSSKCITLKYTKAVDIWSLGCTFAELLTGKILFPGKNYVQQIKYVISYLGTPTEEEMKIIKNPNALKFIQSLPNKKRVHVKSFIKYENEDALDLLNKMLQYDPAKRITAAEAVKHKYFENVHDPEDVQLFKGEIDFDFEKDQNLTLEKIKLMIIE